MKALPLVHPNIEPIHLPPTPYYSLCPAPPAPPSLPLSCHWPPCKSPPTPLLLSSFVLPSSHSPCPWFI